MAQQIGYARVSTIGQTLDTQIQVLGRFGCAKIFREKASGANADRIQLRRLIRAVSNGDRVIVTRIDRLARSTFDLFAIVKEITEKGGNFIRLQSRGQIPQQVQAA